MTAARAVGSWVAAAAVCVALVHVTLSLAEIGGWPRFVAALAFVVAVVPLAVRLSADEPPDGPQALHGQRGRSRGRWHR